MLAPVHGPQRDLFPSGSNTFVVSSPLCITYSITSRFRELCVISLFLYVPAGYRLGCPAVLATVKSSNDSQRILRTAQNVSVKDSSLYIYSDSS